MANTLKFGNGQWATKEGSTLAYNDENGNFKPLPFNFERSTGATRVNKQGLIEVVSNNEPRIDFTNDSKGALLLEPSRTNLFPYSEDFNTWSRSGWTLTSGLLAPNGGLDAYSVLRTTGSTFAQTLTLLGNTTYTFTSYIKNVNATNIQLRVQNQAGNTSGTESNCIVFSVTDQTNDSNFTRITHTFNTGDAGSYGLFLGYYSAGEYIVYGAQLEQGSYATSYIPTQGSVVTRVAETCNGAGNSQVFNDSEGVLYFNGYIPNDGNEKIIQLSNNTSNAGVIRIFARGNGNDIRFQIVNLGSSTVSIELPLPSDNFYKLAFKYKTNDVSVWSNGFKLYTDTIATIPTGLNELLFGSDTGNPFYGKVKDVRVYNTALTDQELIVLTS